MKRKDIYARISIKFHTEIEKIKDERLRLGLDKKRMSTRELTDLIIRYNGWKVIRKDLIDYDPNKEDE